MTVRKMFLLLCLCNFLQVFIYSGCKSLLFCLGLIFKVANCVTLWSYIRNILMVNCFLWDLGEDMLFLWSSCCLGLFCPPVQRVELIMSSRSWPVLLLVIDQCVNCSVVSDSGHYWFLKASSGFISHFFLFPHPLLSFPLCITSHDNGLTWVLLLPVLLFSCGLLGWSFSNSTHSAIFCASFCFHLFLWNVWFYSLRLMKIKPGF